MISSDYEAKYLGKSQEITPARISDEMTKKVSEIAKRAYEVLKMKASLKRIYIGKRRTTHAGNEHHSRINNRKFD
jgi:hypothetical protein